MSAAIPEADWRHFKGLHRILLNRFCSRVLQDVAAISHATDGTPHERYLRVYKLLRKTDQELARAFDDFRRSTAVMQLAIMRKIKLLTDEDLSGFSQPTQGQILMIASI